MHDLSSQGGTPDPDQGPGLGFLIFSGLAVLTMMFGGLVAWSVLAPLESAAVAPGSVSVEFNRKTIKHLEGGIVSKILVAEGDKVRAGQMLIKLDETQARAQLELLRGRRESAAARFARLVAERRGHDRIVFPDWFEQRRGDPRLDEIAARQASIFETRRVALQSQTAILTKRIVQLEEEITGLRGQIKSTRRGLAILGEEVSVVEALVKKGLARKPRLLELQRMEASRQGELSKAISAVARAEQRIGETRLQITDLGVVRNSEITQEMRDVQTELLELGEQLGVAEDVVQRSRIVAPLDGTVVGLQVHTVGGVVGAAEPLVHIIPRDDRLIIEARIDPIDIDVVRAGLMAHVTLTSFNSRHSPALEGKVISVSADSIVDDRDGTTYYLARIELDDDGGAATTGASLRPGMPAQVMIVTGRHTIFEYLLEPLTRTFTVAFREE